MRNPDKGQVGSLQEYDKLGRPGDMFVAAQAKGLKAQLWTHDAQLIRKLRAYDSQVDKMNVAADVKSALRFGVQLAPECELGGKAGVEFPHRARAWLGVDQIHVSPDGTVMRGASIGKPALAGSRCWAGGRQSVWCGSEGSRG